MRGCDGAKERAGAADAVEALVWLGDVGDVAGR